MFLIGFEKSFERDSVEAVVGIGDNSEGEMINARIIFKRAGFEFWQFAVIFARQILPDFAQLFFDDVKIINQPFGGWCQRFVPRRARQCAIDVDQLVFIVFESRQQVKAALFFGGDAMRGGKFRRLRQQSFKTEDFPVQRRFVFNHQTLRNVAASAEFQKIKHFLARVGYFFRTISTVQ